MPQGTAKALVIGSRSSRAAEAIFIIAPSSTSPAPPVQEVCTTRRLSDPLLPAALSSAVRTHASATIPAPAAAMTDTQLQPYAAEGMWNPAHEASSPSRAPPALAGDLSFDTTAESITPALSNGHSLASLMGSDAELTASADTVPTPPDALLEDVPLRPAPVTSDAGARSPEEPQPSALPAASTTWPARAPLHPPSSTPAAAGPSAMRGANAGLSTYVNTPAKGATGAQSKNKVRRARHRSARPSTPMLAKGPPVHQAAPQAVPLPKARVETHAAAAAPQPGQEPTATAEGTQQDDAMREDMKMLGVAADEVNEDPLSVCATKRRAM